MRKTVGIFSAAFKTRRVINIDVFLDIEDGLNSLELPVASSKKSKSSNRRSNPHSNKSTFGQFCNQIYSMVRNKQFRIASHNFSNRNNSVSYYIYFYPTDSDGNEINDLIAIRISNHLIPDWKYDSEAHRKQIADLTMNPNSAFPDIYHVKYVTIDGHQFKTVDDAKEYLSTMLNEIKSGNVSYGDEYIDPSRRKY